MSASEIPIEDLQTQNFAVNHPQNVPPPPEYRDQLEDTNPLASPLPQIQHVQPDEYYPVPSCELIPCLHAYTCMCQTLVYSLLAILNC